MIDNPLLAAGDRPAFDRIRPEHIGPAVDTALARHEAAVESVLAADPRTFASVVVAKELADAAFSEVWSVVGHLKSVVDNPELRAAHDAAQPKVLAHLARLAQNPALYTAFEESLAYGLGAVERRAVELALRDLSLAGVALEEPGRSRFAQISVALGRLQSAFGDAVLDATNSWSLQLTDEARLGGVPAAERAMLAAAARDAGQVGWRITLQAPSVRAILTFAEDRELRAQVYRAFHTRASDHGPDAGRFDNSSRMREILALRGESAALLGYSSPVSESLAAKMASSPAQVLAFLRDLAVQARPFAKAELADAQRFAADVLGLETLEPWDMAFVSERMRQTLHALDEGEIKQYLPADRVIDGLRALLARVFGIILTEVEGVAAWHPDVRYYSLSRGEGEPFAGVYFDLYARPGKQGGAWMNVCRARIDAEGRRQAPVAYLVCNFAAPDTAGVSMLTHSDLLTLLHEIGHCLHHLLGEVTLPSIGGISGFEWDAVELPSQLMENFGWDPGVLETMSGHVETGEPLPAALIQRMRSARGFHAGLAMLRQIEFSLYDLEIHAAVDELDADPDLVMNTLARVRAEIAVNHPPSWTRFPHAFVHIFAGGYAAGYYSYLWAERLSADGFEKFTEAGYAEAGEAFRAEVLSRGASRSAAESYLAFRGREANNSALLRFRGLEPDLPRLGAT